VIAWDRPWLRVTSIDIQHFLQSNENNVARLVELPIMSAIAVDIVLLLLAVPRYVPLATVPYLFLESA
jgi:hypothetical protein